MEKNKPRTEEEIKEDERKKIPPSADDPNRERVDNDDETRKE